MLGIGLPACLLQLGLSLSIGRGRSKSDALDMVLEIETDVGEQSLEDRGELVETELVQVKRVGAGETASLGVVVAVGGGYQEYSASGQNAVAFVKEGLPVGQVLDHFEGDHEVEAGVGKGHRGAGALHEPHASGSRSARGHRRRLPVAISIPVTLRASCAKAADP